MNIQKIVDEHTEQKRYFTMIKQLTAKHPDLILVHSIPNGSLRNKIIAKKLKSEGVKSGVLDISIPLPNKKYSGLYIEMKKKKGWSVSENQKFFLNYLNDLGYCAIVCKGAEEAFKITTSYLDDEKVFTKRYAISIDKFKKKTGLNFEYRKIAIEKGWCE